MQKYVCARVINVEEAQSFFSCVTSLRHLRENNASENTGVRSQEALPSLHDTYWVRTSQEPDVSTSTICYTYGKMTVLALTLVLLDPAKWSFKYMLMTRDKRYLKIMPVLSSVADTE
ncbi:hypothetical protein PNOK_0473400 [Pyrrhoderma noxium]|uniref:Uncharacterized protein n=1 Tax=Pyrrhoderma noxium TaxID=2282107 RepID=A0A286UJN9_9AGAM|nr:hypothetical protein PNOK_0473400 [Pyrrhoderma noxium]